MSAKDKSQTIRLFPSPRLNKETSTPLSILDATVARFAPTGAIWIYDSIPSGEKGEDFVNGLQTSFVATLNSFPHWAGQLQWAPFRPGGQHTERFNRPMVVYGGDSDSGVEWTVVRHEFPVESLAPVPGDRANGSAIWIGDGFPQDALVSHTPLALHDLCEYKGLPGMLVQINLFRAGGYAIGIKMAHPLADAQALMVFMHQWAANNRGEYGQSSRSLMGVPVFDPVQLDSRAAGDIDASSPDPDLCKIARELPMHRYDWWATSAPGYPSIFIPTIEASKPPPGLVDEKIIDSASTTVPPWETWDITKPVTYALLHFTGDRLDRLRDTARGDPDGRPDISRLDALLAHIWRIINQARDHTQSPEEVYLNLTLGARTRVRPQLPSNFIGSPLFLVHTHCTGKEASTESMGKLSSKIRETISLITPEKMGAVLHDAAHEVSPQRLWQAFLGSRHTLVTSWLRLGVYDVDFEGRGERPRYVHALMPKVDGCLQVMDAGVDDGGIDVALYLEGEAMKRLLQIQI